MRFTKRSTSAFVKASGSQSRMHVSLAFMRSVYGEFSIVSPVRCSPRFSAAFFTPSMGCAQGGGGYGVKARRREQAQRRSVRGRRRLEQHAPDRTADYSGRSPSASSAK
jgi:hypothetical protein